MNSTRGRARRCSPGPMANSPRSPPTSRPGRPRRCPAPPPPVALGTPASAKAAVWAACVIAALPAVWAAFLTFYGGFVILFLLAFAGLVLTTEPRPHEEHDRGLSAT